MPLPDNAMCLGCGYLLRGLPRCVCPECGRVFDPEDKSTYRLRRGDLKWRRFAAPPRSWHVAAVIVCTAYGLDLASTGGTSFGAERLFSRFVHLLFCGMPIILLGLSADYMVRLAASLAAKRWPVGDAVTRGGSSRSRWLPTPLCLALLLSALAHPWPLKLRFELSRGALEWVANDYLAGRHANTGPQRIGLYYVESIESDAPGTVAFTTAMDLIDPVGLVYDPGAVTPSWCKQPIAPHWCLNEL